ncbi:MAG: hypothetical protein EA405_00915 [Rhodospirillales bacterium]|nr:MAG: hypothetical protein EA405_00915 [Rhodospirillales bacterium]
MIKSLALAAALAAAVPTAAVALSVYDEADFGGGFNVPSHSLNTVSLEQGDNLIKGSLQLCGSVVGCASNSADAFGFAVAESHQVESVVLSVGHDLPQKADLWFVLRSLDPFVNVVNMPLTGLETGHSTGNMLEAALDPGRYTVIVQDISGGDVSGTVNWEVELRASPLPSSILLFAGALGVLAYLRRRSHSA